MTAFINLRCPVALLNEGKLRRWGEVELLAGQEIPYWWFSQPSAINDMQFHFKEETSKLGQ